MHINFDGAVQKNFYKGVRGLSFSRVPSLILHLNMPAGGKHLSAAQRALVVDCAKGRSLREAAVLLAQKHDIHITFCTVGNIVKAWNRSHRLERKKGSGASCKLTVRQQRVLCRMARSDRWATASELVQQGGFPVSKWTAGRVLRSKGLH